MIRNLRRAQKADSDTTVGGVEYDVEGETVRAVDEEVRVGR
jgi:hypothetical protein